MTARPPTVRALLLCDAVWRDPGTGKHFILGTFANMNSASFPARHENMAVFAVLTDGDGRVPLSLSVVARKSDDDPAEETLAKAELEVQFADEKTIVEATFSLRGLRIPHPGEYAVRLKALGCSIMERRFTATLLESKS